MALYMPDLGTAETIVGLLVGALTIFGLIAKFSSRVRGYLKRSWQKLGPYQRPFGSGDFCSFLARAAADQPGNDFNGRLLIVDHLGNLHSTNRFKIKSRVQRKKAAIEETKEIPRERIHTISDPLEKQAVAILKDEVIRYRECGRKSGGLGSVQVTYENRTLNGIGYQGRRANSPLPQWLVPDSSKAEIHSDNLTSMLELAKDTKSRAKLASILLQRIKGGNEYSSIGYFLLLVLFRLGHLPDALKAIRTELLSDEDFAFDNSVMMLSGPLQYEYLAFDDRLLDDVERFSEGLDGSLHHLPERQTAARAQLASRMSAPPKAKQNRKRRPAKRVSPAHSSSR